MGSHNDRRRTLRRRLRDFALVDVPVSGTPRRPPPAAGSKRKTYDDPTSTALAGPGLDVTTAVDDRHRQVVFGSVAASLLSWLLLGVIVPSMVADMAGKGGGAEVVGSLTKGGLVHLLVWVSLMTNLGWAVMAWQTSRGPDGNHHAPFFDATVPEGHVLYTLVSISLGVGAVALLLVVLLIVTQLIGVLEALVVFVLQVAFFVAIAWFVFRRVFGGRR